MFKRLHPVQKREAGVTANVLLSMIDRMKADTLSPLQRGYSEMEADAYNVHGRIALNEGTDESGGGTLGDISSSVQSNWRC